MNNAPSILILTNEHEFGSAPGQKDGFIRLANAGYFKYCAFMSHKFNNSKSGAYNEILELCRNKKFDAILIWSPVNFPRTILEFESLMKAIGDTPIFYWEGDPWSSRIRKKSITPQMKWWLESSKGVFSIAAEPHVSLFKKNGAKKIFFIPHTYCHIQFKREVEEFPPRVTENSQRSIAMIANNGMKVPGLSGNPGSLSRFKLAFKIHNLEDIDFHLYGRNWPSRSSLGPLPYGKQVEAIRKCSMSVNWDNFSSYQDYASDRLAISLLAGRAHVTTRHPGMTWLPGPEVGLFLESSPNGIVNQVNELIQLGPSQLTSIGLNGYRWVKGRLSHREAALYISSKMFDHIPAPTQEPWTKLPGPW